MAYTSSCHCGTIRATVEGDMPADGMTCNCSICRRKGHILHFVPKETATINAPAEMLGDYTFNKHIIHHHFCKVCGCSPFGLGSDVKGNEMVAINLRCVPECDIEALKLNQYDGASQ